MNEMPAHSFIDLNQLQLQGSTDKFSYKCLKAKNI